MPGYQDILNQNMLYMIVETNVKPITSPWIEDMCMFKPLT
jgi:hypothetical protein